MANRFFKKAPCACGNKDPRVSSHQGTTRFHVCCEVCGTCGPHSSSDPWGNEPFAAVANDAIALWNSTRHLSKGPASEVVQ